MLCQDIRMDGFSFSKSRRKSGSSLLAYNSDPESYVESELEESPSDSVSLLSSICASDIDYIGSERFLLNFPPPPAPPTTVPSNSELPSPRQKLNAAGMVRFKFNSPFRRSKPSVVLKDISIEPPHLSAQQNHPAPKSNDTAQTKWESGKRKSKKSPDERLAELKRRPVPAQLENFVVNQLEEVPSYVRSAEHPINNADPMAFATAYGHPAWQVYTDPALVRQLDGSTTKTATAQVKPNRSRKDRSEVSNGNKKRKQSPSEKQINKSPCKQIRQKQVRDEQQLLMDGNKHQRQHQHPQHHHHRHHLHADQSYSGAQSQPAQRRQTVRFHPSVIDNSRNNLMSYQLAAQYGYGPMATSNPIYENHQQINGAIRFDDVSPGPIAARPGLPITRSVQNHEYVFLPPQSNVQAHGHGHPLVGQEQFWPARERASTVIEQRVEGRKERRRVQSPLDMIPEQQSKHSSNEDAVMGLTKSPSLNSELADQSANRHRAQRSNRQYYNENSAAPPQSLFFRQPQFGPDGSRQNMFIGYAPRFARSDLDISQQPPPAAFVHGGCLYYTPNAPLPPAPPPMSPYLAPQYHHDQFYDPAYLGPSPVSPHSTYDSLDWARAVHNGFITSPHLQHPQQNPNLRPQHLQLPTQHRHSHQLYTSPVPMRSVSPNMPAAPPSRPASSPFYLDSTQITTHYPVSPAPDNHQTLSEVDLSSKAVSPDHSPSVAAKDKQPRRPQTMLDEMHNRLRINKKLSCNLDSPKEQSARPLVGQSPNTHFSNNRIVQQEQLEVAAMASMLGQRPNSGERLMSVAGSQAQSRQKPQTRTESRTTELKPPVECESIYDSPVEQPIRLRSVESNVISTGASTPTSRFPNAATSTSPIEVVHRKVFDDQVENNGKTREITVGKAEAQDSTSATTEDTISNQNDDAQSPIWKRRQRNEVLQKRPEERFIKPHRLMQRSDLPLTAEGRPLARPLAEVRRPGRLMSPIETDLDADLKQHQRSSPELRTVAKSVEANTRKVQSRPKFDPSLSRSTNVDQFDNESIDSAIKELEALCQKLENLKTQRSGCAATSMGETKENRHSQGQEKNTSFVAASTSVEDVNKTSPKQFLLRKAKMIKLMLSSPEFTTTSGTSSTNRTTSKSSLDNLSPPIGRTSSSTQSSQESVFQRLLGRKVSPSTKESSPISSSDGGIGVPIKQNKPFAKIISEKPPLSPRNSTQSKTGTQPAPLRLRKAVSDNDRVVAPPTVDLGITLTKLDLNEIPYIDDDPTIDRKRLYRFSEHKKIYHNDCSEKDIITASTSVEQLREQIFSGQMIETSTATTPQEHRRNLTDQVDQLHCRRHSLADLMSIFQTDSSRRFRSRSFDSFSISRTSS